MKIGYGLDFIEGHYEMIEEIMPNVLKKVEAEPREIYGVHKCDECGSYVKIRWGSYCGDCSKLMSDRTRKLTAKKVKKEWHTVEKVCGNLRDYKFTREEFKELQNFFYKQGISDKKHKDENGLHRKPSFSIINKYLEDNKHFYRFKRGRRQNNEVDLFYYWIELNK